jgi:multiple sugar transport system permease protein
MAASVAPLTTAPPVHRVSSRSQPRRRRWDRFGWIFLAPYVVLLLAFGVGPTGYAIYESLVDERGTHRGLSLVNYQRTFEDFRFWPAAQNVGMFLLIWLPVMVIGVVFFALLLHGRLDRFSGMMRLLYFLPCAVTGAASVVLWYFMLQPHVSPFGPELRAMGITSGSQLFQTQNLAVIFAVIAFSTGAGQWIVIMFGALQNVSTDVMEAARVDGCGPVRLALAIKLPLVSKYVLYMVILCFASGVQIFVEPQLILAATRTAGSPWWSLNQLSYAFAFSSGDFGSAAAVSVILLGVCTLGAFALIFRTDFFRTEVDS